MSEIGSLTRAQSRWYKTLERNGFVEFGGWGNGQKNRPLQKLVDLGLARPEWGPIGSMFKTQGVVLERTV